MSNRKKTQTKSLLPHILAILAVIASLIYFVIGPTILRQQQIKKLENSIPESLIIDSSFTLEVGYPWSKPINLGQNYYYAYNETHKAALYIYKWGNEDLEKATSLSDPKSPNEISSEYYQWVTIGKDEEIKAKLYDFPDAASRGSGRTKGVIFRTPNSNWFISFTYNGKSEREFEIIDTGFLRILQSVELH